MRALFYRYCPSRFLCYGSCRSIWCALDAVLFCKVKRVCDGHDEAVTR